MAVVINGSAGVTTNSGAVYNGLQTGTAVTASGTSVDFTSIPSWVRRITVMFNGVSLSGTSAILVQLGDSGGVENTGYNSSACNQAGTVTSSTAGFVMIGALASLTVSGLMTVSSLGSNTWIESFSTKLSTGATGYGGGDKQLSDTLTQVRITTVNGTDTFDAGTINIIYE